MTALKTVFASSLFFLCSGLAYGRLVFLKLEKEIQKYFFYFSEYNASIKLVGLSLDLFK